MNNRLFSMLVKSLGLNDIPTYQHLKNERKNGTALTSTGGAPVKPQRKLLLLLVDYKPLIKYIDGVPCYLNVDVYSEDGSTFYRSSTNKESSEQMISLDDLAELYPQSKKFITDFALATGNKVYEFDTIEERNSKPLGVGEIAFTNSYVCQPIQYSIRNFELQAVIYLSPEMLALRDAIDNNKDSVTNNRYRISDRMYLDGKEVSRMTWLRALYENHMIEANLELMEYYYRNQKKPSSTRMFQMNRVLTFDEFVPVALKFSGIPNPILDTDEETGATTEYYSELMRVKLFQNVVLVQPLSAMNGRVSSVTSESKNTYGLYSTRAEIGRYLGIDVSKRTKDYLRGRGYLPINRSQINIDLYSPCSHMGLIYRDIFSHSENPYVFMTSLDSPVTLKYQTFQPEDVLIQPFVGVRILGFSGTPISEIDKSANTDYNFIEINKYQELILSYMNGVYGVLRPELIRDVPELTFNPNA